MGWCEPVPGTITPAGCRLRTYIYRIDLGSQTIWAPTHAAGVKFAYSVLGEAATSSLGAEAETMSRGLSLVSGNPLTGEDVFKLKLPVSVAVKMDVFDVAGRRVKSLVDGPLLPGLHEVAWNTRDDHGARLPSGLYFVRVRAENAHLVRKFVLVQ
jgi:hypothetical protein